MGVRRLINEKIKQREWLALFIHTNILRCIYFISCIIVYYPCAVLCNIVLCFIMLCRAVLYCVVLCSGVSLYVRLGNAMPCY